MKTYSLESQYGKARELGREKWKGSERKSVGEAIRAKIYSRPAQPQV